MGLTGNTEAGSHADNRSSAKASAIKYDPIGIDVFFNSEERVGRKQIFCPLLLAGLALVQSAASIVKREYVCLQQIREFSQPSVPNAHVCFRTWDIDQCEVRLSFALPFVLPFVEYRRYFLLGYLLISLLSAFYPHQAWKR